jgi:YVTN family beta-propeller protein
MPRDRRPIGLLALTAIAACGGERASPPAAAAVPTEYAYVTNEDSHDITIIDTRTDSVMIMPTVGATS